MMSACKPPKRQERLELFSFLKDGELSKLRLRRAFMRDRDRLKEAVASKRGTSWRELSVRVGYKEDTLSSVFSDSMVLGQSRYNYRALILSLRKLGMRPSPPLIEYEEAKMK